MCSMGYCDMTVESFCSTKSCSRQIYPDGQAEGIVLLSSSTAATAIIMRDMAREVTTGGSTFNACYRRWYNKFADLRDLGVFPAMMNVKAKSRKTITPLFFLSLRLMCKDPPLWAFRCSSCEDKDGRFRVVTADGIWMGV